MQPRFQTVQYILYWTVLQKLSNIASFCDGNIDYIVQSRGANPALLLADCYIVDIYILVLDALPSNIEYTERRNLLDEASAESNIAFLSPGYFILNGKAYHILYIIHYIDYIK